MKWLILFVLVSLFVSCEEFAPSPTGGCEHVPALYKASTSCPAPADYEWASKEPAAYSYTYARQCFCVVDYVGPFLVESLRDSVTRVRRLTLEGDTVEITTRLQSYSVDSAFAEIRRHLSWSYAHAEVRYDSAYTFPAFFHVDHHLMLADDEFGLTLTDFRNLAE